MEIEDQHDPRNGPLNTMIRVAIVGVLAILALFLVAETVVTSQNIGRPSNAPTNTITVSGQGQATVAPNVATVSFTVQNTAATVSAAQNATTKQANAALAFVKNQGIADKDVRTTSYTVTPQYARGTCPPGTYCPVDTSKITGYQVAESVQVTLHDLTKVGAFMQGLGQQQVQNVSGPDFTLADPTQGYDQARADAISKAKAQAASIASQLGVQLGSIVNFSESNNGRTPIMYSASSVAGAGGGTETPNLPTGQNTYNASVSITYAIR